jgi:hypothetical protein
MRVVTAAVVLGLTAALAPSGASAQYWNAGGWPRAGGSPALSGSPG